MAAPNTKPENKRFFACFMSYIRDAEYDPNHPWTDDKLNSVRPREIERFFNQEAYKTETPTVDDRPTAKRGNTLKAYKTKISYFMLSNNKWNPVSETGNPTTAKSVNDLVGRVFRFQS